MADENKNNPAFKTKNMQLDETVRVKLLSPSPIANGVSKYGQWRLRPIEVTNQTVEERSGNKIENYTGEAIMFPSDKLEEKFMDATNEVNENVVVDITKKAKTSERGSLYTDYDVSVIDSGSERVQTMGAENPFSKNTQETPQDFLNPVETQCVNAAKEVVQQSPGKLTKEMFVSGADVSFNISKDRADILWDKYVVG